MALTPWNVVRTQTTPRHRRATERNVIRWCVIDRERAAFTTRAAGSAARRAACNVQLRQLHADCSNSLWADWLETFVDRLGQAPHVVLGASLSGLLAISPPWTAQINIF